MKAIGILIATLILLTGVCHADDSDDTLRFFLSRSDLVVLGTITPIGEKSAAGVSNYILEFKVSDVCKGNTDLKGKTIQVNIQRFEMDKKDHHPLIKKDAKCILFLKKETTVPHWQWVSADFWFGIHHPFPWMVKSLKRLAKGNIVEQKNSPDKK